MAQGEHVAIIGDTGTGKSTLAARLLLSRRFTLALKTKRDPIQFPGKLATQLTNARGRSILADPREDRWHLDLSTGRKIETFRREQEIEITRLLNGVWNAGGWTLLLDETYYIDTVLKMRKRLEAILTQGRSMGISLYMGIQRPVDVSRFVLSSASHIIVFRQDGRDSDTLGKASTTALKSVIDTLGPYEFAWFHRPSRRIWRGTLDLDGNKLEGMMVD
jgi:DNA helicase HerA-like ATPase